MSNKQLVRAVTNLSEFAVMIFHTMTFIDDHVLPRQFGQHRLVPDDVLVSGEQNIELDRSHLVLDVAAHRRRTFVANDVDRRRPLVKLERPIRQCRQRHDDQKRTVVLLGFDQISDQTNGLDCFTQTHFVGQDAVQIVVVQ